jgi:hypothetical protein
MKKTSLLLAIGALLYGASGSYALAADNIYRQMSDQEIDTVIQANCPGVNIDVPADLDDAEDTIDTGVSTVAQALPANVTVDDSNPIYMREFCGFRPTGFAMANFPVRVNNSNDAIFRPYGPNSGVAVGDYWLLYQSGDTWNKKWCLVTEEPINTVKIDPLGRTGPGPEKYAFDIINSPTHSDGAVGGSQKGWAITGKTADFTAVYSNPVYVPPDPSQPHPGHDMYGTLEITFTSPLTGSVDLEGFFIFRADTDCLPVQEVLLNSYDGTTLNFTVVGEGAVAITTTDGAVVQGPFVVGRGDGSANIVTQFTPQAGLCYVMADVDTGKVMTEEHCFQ